jgi:SAM-dependent methyltransferase
VDAAARRAYGCPACGGRRGDATHAGADQPPSVASAGGPLRRPGRLVRPRSPRLQVTTTATGTLARLLGPGAGSCLDLGCGSGVAVPALAGLGWRVVGVDLSGDQLRVAREHAGGLSIALVQADAAALPFDDGSFQAVVSLLTHTDLDDPEGAFAEAARVLQPGGRLIYVGTHPCFVTPFVERRLAGTHLLHPGYRERGWRSHGPGFGPGIRPRVGVNHLPLADLIGAFLATGLTLRGLEEPGDEDYPFLIALTLQR